VAAWTCTPREKSTGAHVRCAGVRAGARAGACAGSRAGARVVQGAGPRVGRRGARTHKNESMTEVHGQHPSAWRCRNLSLFPHHIAHRTARERERRHLTTEGIELHRIVLASHVASATGQVRCNMTQQSPVHEKVSPTQPLKSCGISGLDCWVEFHDYFKQHDLRKSFNTT
jgi:hypothetical protein